MANFICSLHKTLKLCSGEALFYKDNSVPWCSRNNPAVSILSQPLLQTTLITTQSTLKALVPCKGHSGPQCQSFWIEEIFHPRHAGLHRGESYTSRWFWWHWNYWVMVFVSSSRCFEHFFFLEKKKKNWIFSKNQHLQTAVYLPKPSQHNQYVQRETDCGKQSLNSVL